MYKEITLFEILAILQILSIAILVLLVKNYFPSYAKKKGENLATKEDIHEITHKIESVRSDINFSKELEQQYIDKKLDLLLAFFDHVTEFHYERQAVNFGDFPIDGGKSLYEFQIAFYKSIAEILKSYQRLVVFLPPNSTILHNAEQIVNSAITSRNIMKKFFYRVKKTIVEEGEAFASNDSKRIEKAVKEADEANSTFWKEMDPIVKVYREYYQKFLGELNEYVKPKSHKA